MQFFALGSFWREGERDVYNWKIMALFFGMSLQLWFCGPEEATTAATAIESS